MLLIALALAGSSVAGAPAPPFASSPTIIDHSTTEPPAAEPSDAVVPREPQIEGPPELSGAIGERAEWGRRLDEIIAAQSLPPERPEREAKQPPQPPSPRETSVPIYDDIGPLLDPKEANAALLPEPSASHGPPVLGSRMAPAEYSPTYPSEAYEDDRQQWTSVVAAFGLLLAGLGGAWLWDNRVRAFPVIGRAARRFTERRRSMHVGVIATGLLIVAASLTVLKHPELGYDYSGVERLIDAGWLTLLGAAITIIGIYDKLQDHQPPKI